MWKLIYCVCSVFLVSESILAQLDCKVEINAFPDKLPVFELDNGDLVVNQGRELKFSHNQRVHATCAGRNNGVKYGDTGADGGPFQALTCVGGNVFHGDPRWIPGGNVNISNIQCKNYSPSLIMTEDNSCGGPTLQHTTVKVNVEGQTPHLVLQSCFSKRDYRLLYAIHQLSPEINYTQTSSRTEFTTHDLFRPIRMDRIYTKNSQFATLNEILGGVADRYMVGDRVLERGHLVPFVDFSLASLQKPTMTHLNAVPQWKKFNNGNWKALERDIRKKVVANRMRIKIYTGGHDTLKLQDRMNNWQEIYLSRQPVGIPVPLWLYKVVYDMASGRAVAFLGLNNPTVNVTTARLLGRQICEDICSSVRFNWLRWKKDDTEEGYSMCCDVQDFRRSVPNFPNFRVTGVLDFEA